MCHYYRTSTGEYICQCGKTKRPGYHLSIARLNTLPEGCISEVKRQKKEWRNHEIEEETDE